jgi:hypothetical protein
VSSSGLSFSSREATVTVTATLIAAKPEMIFDAHRYSAPNGGNI